MRTEDLQAFFAVVETGSLTRAAKRQQLPKSTLSRRLDRLEEELDRQLLVRTPRRTQITAVGLQLYERAEPLLAELDELQAQVTDEPAEPSGAIRVAAPEDVTTALLGRLCAGFLRAHPKVQLSLLSSNVAVDLLAESFDVAVRVHMSRLAPTTTLKVKRLATVPLGLYAAPTYLDEHPVARDPARLVEHSLLSMAALMPTWSLAHKTRPAAKLHVAPQLVSNDHHALLDTACEGGGVALLPVFVASRAVQKGALKRVLPQWAPPPGTMSLLWPTTRHTAPRVRAFLDYALQHLPSALSV